MRKYWNRIGICLITVVLFWVGGLIADRQLLRQELVRLHVVAASDSAEDQRLKLRVRDAILESLQSDMEKLTDVEAAKAYLLENLPKIEGVANRVLREAGCTDLAAASLAVEEFSTRVYDTFSLPAGIYDTLRITIGEGEGHNWWCVVFPSLCLPATAEGFAEAASCAGFPEELTAALEGEEGYEIRFYFLDLIGRIENLLREE